MPAMPIAMAGVSWIEHNSFGLGPRAFDTLDFLCALACASSTWIRGFASQWSHEFNLWDSPSASKFQSWESIQFPVTAMWQAIMEEAGRFEKSRMLPAMVMKPPGVTYSTFVGTNNHLTFESRFCFEHFQFKDLRGPKLRQCFFSRNQFLCRLKFALLNSCWRGVQEALAWLKQNESLILEKWLGQKLLETWNRTQIQAVHFRKWLENLLKIA